MAVNSFREDEQIKSTDAKKIIKRLFGYLKEYKAGIVIVLLAMGITVGINLANPLILEYAIDNYVAKGDVKGLLILGVIAVALSLLFIVFVRVRIYVMSKISNEILLKIRQEMYEHIQTLSFSFFDGRPSGKILARITGDVNSLKEVLTKAVTTLIPEAITVIGVLVIMLVKDWKLALASLCSLPILAVGIFTIQRINHKRWQVVRKKASNLNAYVHEDVAGIRVVQSLCAE